MRRNTGNIALICGGAAVIFAAIAIFLSLPDRDCTELTIGTYGENIYLYSFDNESLEFSLESKAEVRNGSYALSCRDEKGHNGTFAVSETGKESGIVSFDKAAISGKSGLRLTAEKIQTGADPCFIMLYDDNKYLFTADYSGGSISIFPISEGCVGERLEKLDFEGSGPIKGRQESSHIHQIRQIPAIENFGNDWLLASDLGCDVLRLIYVSHVHSTINGESIMPVHVHDFPCPPGSGPRHMEFSSDGRVLYCIAELSDEVLVYDISNRDGQPELKLKQRIQANEVNAGGSADIHIHPSGKWLYTSHRLDNDGIAIFSIKDDGELKKIGYAKTARHPRNFMITEDGNFLLVACRDDGLVQVFRINDDGGLELTPSILKFDSDRPSSVTSH